MPKFRKVLGHARPPEDGKIFSAEDFTLESGEVHSYRTGIVLDGAGAGEGKVLFLATTMEQGTKGVTIAGPLVAYGTELRVNLINLHREAREIKSGQAIAQVLELAASTPEFTE